MRLTIDKIEKLAAEIIDYCKRHEFGDTIVYYNGKRTFINYDGDNSTEPANVHDYLEYCGDIISVSFEGSMYDVFNYSYDCDWAQEIIDEFNSIIGKYGLYYEHGNSWNITLCG